MVWWLERWTCNFRVAGLSPSHDRIIDTIITSMIITPLGLINQIPDGVKAGKTLQTNGRHTMWSHMVRDFLYLGGNSCETAIFALLYFCYFPLNRIITSHSRYWTEIFPVLLHSCVRHAVTTTTAFILLWCLHVLLVRLSTVSSRTFSVSGAAVWNDLPALVTSAPSLAVFRQLLKTFLFSCSYPDTVIWF